MQKRMRRLLYYGKRRILFFGGSAHLYDGTNHDLPCQNLMPRVATMRLLLSLTVFTGLWLPNESPTVEKPK